MRHSNSANQVELIQYQNMFMNGLTPNPAPSINRKNAEILQLQYQLQQSKMKEEEMMK